MKMKSWGLAIVWLLACAASAPPSAQDDFFDKAKLIMSKTEIEIYSHLADDQAREEFIADFWEKRDPAPGSGRNEFEAEFYKRVDFANRWFHERGTAANGWDSDRGRVLLMLGFPDQRDQMPMLQNPRIKAAEIWIYHSFALRLEFLDYDGMGKFRLDSWPLELLDAIEQVRQLGGGDGRKNLFRFKAAADASGLRIDIPLKYVMAEERGDKVRAAFTVTADVYGDFVKIERLTLTREFVESREEFTARKSILIAVPYAYPKPGKYFLDVIVEELATKRRSREFAKFKLAKKD